MVVSPMSRKVEHGSHARERLLAGSHRRDALPVTNGLGQLLAVDLSKLRCVVPGVDMRWAATHEQIDDLLRLRSKVRQVRQTIVGGSSRDR